LPAGRQRHELPRDAVVASQRNRLLQAMAECVAERGYAATTVAQVVRRAGVSSATFYELFHDKEACFLALMREIIAQATVVVTEAYGRDRPPLELLRDGLGALLELLRSEPAWAKVLFLSSRSSTPRALDLYMSGVRAVASILGTGQGTPRDSRLDPWSVARIVLGGCETIIRREISAGRTEQLPEILPQLMYCALVPIAGQDVAVREWQSQTAAKAQV
jgi:AcrR family transcriptional regulator